MQVYRPITPSISSSQVHLDYVASKWQRQFCTLYTTHNIKNLTTTFFVWASFIKHVTGIVNEEN